MCSTPIAPLARHVSAVRLSLGYQMWVAEFGLSSIGGFWRWDTGVESFGASTWSAQPPKVKAA